MIYPHGGKSGDIFPDGRVWGASKHCPCREQCQNTPSGVHGCPFLSNMCLRRPHSSSFSLPWRAEASKRGSSSNPDPRPLEISEIIDTIDTFVHLPPKPRTQCPRPANSGLAARHFVCELWLHIGALYRI